MGPRHTSKLLTLTDYYVAVTLGHHTSGVQSEKKPNAKAAGPSKDSTAVKVCSMGGDVMCYVGK